MSSFPAHTPRSAHGAAAARTHDLTVVAARRAASAASSRGSSLACLAQMPKNEEESPRPQLASLLRSISACSAAEEENHASASTTI